MSDIGHPHDRLAVVGHLQSSDPHVAVGIDLKLNVLPLAIERSQANIDVGGKRRGQLRSCGVREVHLTQNIGVQDHLKMRVSLHQHEPAVSRGVIHVWNRGSRFHVRRGCGRHGLAHEIDPHADERGNDDGHDDQFLRMSSPQPVDTPIDT